MLKQGGATRKEGGDQESLGLNQCDSVQRETLLNNLVLLNLAVGVWCFTVCEVRERLQVLVC